MRSTANNQLTTAGLVVSTAITDEALNPGAFWNYWTISGSFLATAFPTNVESLGSSKWIALWNSFIGNNVGFSTTNSTFVGSCEYVPVVDPSPKVVE